MACSGIEKHLPTTSYYKYRSCIFVVAEREIRRVFRWLYKGGSVYVGEYLKKQEGGMTRLGSNEKQLLEKQIHEDEFDISFLYKLLQRCCGLEKENNSIWNKPSNNQKESLEHTLFHLKEIRNRLNHTDYLTFMTSEELDQHTDELEKLLCRILTLAGKQSGKSDETAKYSMEMHMDLEEIRTKPIPSGLTKEKLADLARRELRATSPGRNDSFADVAILRVANTETSSLSPLLILSELLQWPCGDSKVPDVIVVGGDTGTGKTSLCRYIFDSWSSGAEDITELQEYDLLFLIQCSDICSRDLLLLLKNSLPETTKSCDIHEVYELLSSLKVMWLVDGFEEATSEAKGLLKWVMENRGTLHMILLTTRPEHITDFTLSIPQDTKLLEVQLLGLSEIGRGTFVERLLQDTTTAKKKPGDFYRELKRLGPEVSKELLNPLKLTLTVDLWKEGIIDMKGGGTLPQLYSAIKRKHTDSLCKKTKAKSPNMTTEECERKVRKWIESLCREAFSMTKSQKYVQLPEDIKNKLIDDSDNLRLYSEDCFSTFLSFWPKIGANELRCYSFLHSTQQFHFAAEHVLAWLSQSNNEMTDGYKLFDCTIASDIGDQFYTVLLHVLSLLPSCGTIKKSLVTTLIKLISNCRRCVWFEVIRYAAYSEVVTSEVCKCMPPNWGISDDDVKAAKLCLSYSSPSNVFITINGDPQQIEEFLPLIRIIAQIPVVVHLMLMYHCYILTHRKTSNSILEILCSKDAACHIVTFYGCITINGYLYICTMSKLQVLCVKILRNKDLVSIIKGIKSLPHLKEVEMIMQMEQLNATRGMAVSENTIFNISLPKISNSHIITTVKSMSAMSHKYGHVQIFNTVPSQTYKFIMALVEKKIKVKRLTLVFKPAGKPFKFELPYGSVPLQYPHQDINQISNTYMELIRNTNISASN